MVIMYMYLAWYTIRQAFTHPLRKPVHLSTIMLTLVTFNLWAWKLHNARLLLL